MTDHRLDQREASSPPSPSSPLDAAGPGASSRPAPAARRTSGPSAGSRRLGLLLAAGAAAGTFAVALAVAFTGPGAAPAADAAAPAAAATTAAPTDQVVVDTVYVRDPAPTANPEPIIVPAPAAPAAEAQVVRVVRVVAGGDHEGAEHDGAEHEGDHDGAGGGEGGEDD